MRIRQVSALLVLFGSFMIAQESRAAQEKQAFAGRGEASQVRSDETLPAISPASSRPEDLWAATEAWLATVPAADRARSDAYFEGGCWIMLWDFLIGVIVALIFLLTRLSARLRDLVERMTRFRPLQTLLYFLMYAIFTLVVMFPMGVYESYFRERQYGLMNLSLGGWFREYLIGNSIGLILGAIAVTALFGIVRRLQRTWWAWGAIFSIVFLTFSAVISPVYFAPLFNSYKKLEDPKLRIPILSMAHANGLPTDDVYWFDASRQSKRVSANVSGFLGTERISLNDNLLNRCTLPEVLTVLGHEIGHYVLNHVYKGILFFSVIIVLFFAYLRWALGALLARWGSRWRIRGFGDVAVIPLVVLVASIFFFVLTPVTNSFTRMEETEADIFGLNAARQPDAEAHVDLMLGEYRKLSPTPLEEFLFFDHPSGRNRIFMAMRWKAEHLRDCDVTPQSANEPKAP